MVKNDLNEKYLSNICGFNDELNGFFSIGIQYVL